jgi:hypothetical protein
MVAVLIAAMLLGAVETTDQNIAAADVKAAFLVNFVKFAEWPTLATDAAICICVAGDDHVAASLRAAARDGAIEAHNVSVKTLAPEETPRGCHVLFIGMENPHRGIAVLEAAAPMPVLTVSDAARFAETGGMIQLFLEKGHMRFAVNVDALQRSRLRLSSRMLGLAKIVTDTTRFTR